VTARQKRQVARSERRKNGLLMKFVDAEAYTGLPYTTLRDAAQKGYLAYVEIGRHWWVKRTELDRFIESRTVKAVA
jgi:excisionase family DNA binding protein